MSQTFNQSRFIAHVVHHGFGAPTAKGLALGEQLTAQGMEHSSAAEEVVARGLTERADEACENRYPTHEARGA